MIMYNLLGVEPPWPELSGPEAVKRSAMKQVRPPVPRHWDSKLAQLIRSGWQPDPAGRPSFAAVLEQLEEVFKSSVGTSYEEYNKKVAPNGHRRPGSSGRAAPPPPLCTARGALALAHCGPPSFLTGRGFRSRGESPQGRPGASPRRRSRVPI